MILGWAALLAHLAPPHILLAQEKRKRKPVFITMIYKSSSKFYVVLKLISILKTTEISKDSDSFTVISVFVYTYIHLYHTTIT